jgi:Fanconi anemia group J protein
MQVLCMAMAHSPDESVLRATFDKSSTFAFQDGVGCALLSLASSVPDGMLVFMPSYSMMNKLVKRWRDTGVTVFRFSCAHHIPPVLNGMAFDASL